MKRLVSLLTCLLLLVTVLPAHAYPAKNFLSEPAFYITDLSFVDPRHGWALGEICITDYDPSNSYHPFQAHDCRLVTRTTADGGATWHALPPPPGTVATATALPSVSRIHFQDRKNGWLFGRVLYVTHDGGYTWQQDDLAGTEIQLAAIGSDTWALVRNCSPAPSRHCNFVLSSIAQNTRHWVPIKTQLPYTDSEAIAQLVRKTRQTAWIITYDPGFSVYHQAHLYATHNSGHDWEPLPLPCLRAPHLYVGQTIATLWLTCELFKGGYITKDLYISNDGGLHWHIGTSGGGAVDNPNILHDLPYSAFFVGAQLLTTQNGYVAYDKPCGLSFEAFIQNTRDGGNSWKTVVAISLPDCFLKGKILLYCLDSYHGWFAMRNVSYRTIDGGQTWTSGSFDSH